MEKRKQNKTKKTNLIAREASKHKLRESLQVRRWKEYSMQTLNYSYINIKQILS